MGKKGLIVTNFTHTQEKFQQQITAFVKAFESLHMSLVPVTNEQALTIVNDKKKKYSFVLFYDKDIYLAKQFEAKGYRVFNCSSTIMNCDDKAFTYLKMQEKKVPTPETVVLPYSMGEDISPRINSILEMVRPLGLPFVLKERVGSFGNQVYLIEDEEQLKLVLHSIGTRPLLAQRFIAESSGKDTRVFVVGKKIVAAANRTNETDFRSNVNQGGTIEACKKIPRKMKKLALKASKCVHADFCGIDIVKEGKEYYVLEINSNARTESIKGATRKDPAIAIAKYIKKNLKKVSSGNEL